MRDDVRVERVTDTSTWTWGGRSDWVESIVAAGRPRVDAEASAAEVEKTFRSSAETGSGVRLYAVKCGEEVVGGAVVESAGLVTALLNVHVVAARRRKGIGTLATTALMRESIEAGSQAISAKVGDRTPVQASLERLGFKPHQWMANVSCDDYRPRLFRTPSLTAETEGPGPEGSTRFELTGPLGRVVVCLLADGESAAAWVTKSTPTTSPLRVDRQVEAVVAWVKARGRTALSMEVDELTHALLEVHPRIRATFDSVDLMFRPELAEHRLVWAPDQTFRQCACSCGLVLSGPARSLDVGLEFQKHVCAEWLERYSSQR